MSRQANLHCGAGKPRDFRRRARSGTQREWQDRRHRSTRRRQLSVEWLEDRRLLSSSDPSGQLGFAFPLGAANDAGSDIKDAGAAVATDGAGNVYVSGMYVGTVDFDPAPDKTFKFNADTYGDAFVAKYSAQGTLIWAKSFSGGFQLHESYDFYRAGDLAVDSSGNLYLTGSFFGLADFDPSPDTYLLNSGSSSAAFVAKLSGEGNLIWARHFAADDSTSSAMGLGVGVDSSGNVYSTGFFSGRVDFQPLASSTFILTSAGGRDIFVSKLNAAGDFIRATQYGGPADDVAWDLALGPGNNLHLTGSFNGSVAFGSGTGPVLTSFGWDDVFVSKLDSDCNHIWARQLGGSATEQSMGIAVDAAGNAYTTGFFWGTPDFDPGSGVHSLASVENGSDVFVSKLDAYGNYVWAKSFGGIIDSDSDGFLDDDRGLSIGLDGAGNVFITGLFRGTADFDPGPGTSLRASAGGTDIFISRLNAHDGSYLGAGVLGGASDDEAVSIAVTSASEVYTTGFFSGTADFDPSALATHNMTCGGPRDGFVSRVVHGATPPAGLTVTVQQASGQPDPTRVASVHFQVVFSDAVNDFTTGDVTVSGGATGVGTVAMVTPIDGKTYDVTVTGLVRNGTVIATVLAGVAHDADGNANVPSISADNVVEYDNMRPAVTIQQADSQADPTGKLPLHFTVVFSEPVMGFEAGDVTLSGGASGKSVAGVTPTGDGKMYDVTVVGTGYGTVIATVAENVAHDAAGNGNTPSTSTDNTVVYDPSLQPLDTSGQFGFAVRAKSTTKIDGATAVATDNAGNVYVAGLFDAVIDFEREVPIGKAFAAKYSPDGTLVWERSLSGAIGGDGSDICVDAAGNVYVTGSFMGTVDFDPGSATYSLNGGSQPATFVLKFNNAGNFVWAQHFLGGENGGLGIAVDSSGNVYTTGYFSGTVDFNPSTAAFSFTSAGYGDIFVSKLGPNGDFIWARRVGGKGDDFGWDIALDAGGNIFATGSFTDLAFFDRGPGQTTQELFWSAGWQDAFVVRLEAAGNLVWAKRMGGPGTDEGRGIVVDGASNVYTTGLYWESGDFNPGDNVYSLPTAERSDAFVSKLDQNGEFVWAKGFGGAGYDEGRSVALDRAGSLFSAGTFQGTVDFDPGLDAFPLSTAGATEIFLSRIDDQTGDFLWADAMGGGGEDEAFAIAADDMDNVYTVGCFEKASDFDPRDASFVLNSAGTYDAFVSKLIYKGLKPRVTINQATDQLDPTNKEPVRFRVEFSQPVSDFTARDVSLTGTAVGSETVATVIPLGTDGTTYNVDVSRLGKQGTVVASIPASAAHVGGHPSAASTSTDNTVTFDLLPPTVNINQATTQSDPTGDAPIHFTVTFSEPVSDFTSGDVTLSGPATGAAVTPVGTAGTTFDVSVTGLSGNGTVGATIAGGVAHDAAGNGSEASTSTDNRVEYRNVLKKQFDFGTSKSLLEAGFVPVHDKTKYSPALGYGWAAGKISSTDRRNGTALDRDLNLTSQGTFLVDVPSGTYDVRVRLGDTGKYAHDLMGLSLEGIAGNPITTAVYQIVEQNYIVAVVDGQLRLDLYDLGGKDKSVAIAGLKVTAVSDDTKITAPAVTVNQAAGQFDPSTTGVAVFDVAFSEPVAGFAADDVELTVSGSGAAPIKTVTGMGTTYQVLVQGLTGRGELTARIRESAALGLSGSWNVASTSTDNSVSFLAPATRFDFGTSKTPVEVGHLPVHEKTTYSASLGYGWAGGKISSTDRRTGSALDRDLNLTSQGVFVVDVFNGTYLVDVRVGDAGKYAHELMGISVEGSPEAIVSTAANQMVWQRFQVDVTDGQLTLNFADRGGKDKYVALAGLMLTRTSADKAIQIIDDGDPVGFSAIGQWTVGAAGHRGDSRSSAAGAGLDVATWSFHVTPGQYRVSATWPAATTNATDALFTVFDGNSPVATTRVHEEWAPGGFRDIGGAWKELGGPYFIFGETLRVTLTDQANANVVADAIRIERVGELALDALPGPETDLAQNRIPNLPIPPAMAADISIDDGADGTGLSISRTRLFVRPTSSATVGEINSLLTGLQAKIIGTYPELKTLLVGIPDTANVAGLKAAVKAFEGSPAVAFAVEDVELARALISAPSKSLPLAWEWNYPPSADPQTGRDGNWGMEAVRTPAMWNLRDFVVRQGETPNTVVVDYDFLDANGDGTNDHPDLTGLKTYRMNAASGALEQGAYPPGQTMSGDAIYHGQHVAGIIGASFDNRDAKGMATGLDGINSVVETHSPADDHFVGLALQPPGLWSQVLEVLQLVAMPELDIDVVNFSIYLDAAGVSPKVGSPNHDANLHNRVSDWGLQVREIAATNPNMMIVACAGNDSSDGRWQSAEEIDAKWVSPFAYAALGPAGHVDGVRLDPSNNIIIVESLNAVVTEDANLDAPNRWQYVKSDFSNMNGHVSAPGSNVLSTWGPTAANANSGEAYVSISGTSMATPHVTGLVGMLRSLESHGPDEIVLLTAADIKQLLTEERFTRKSAPRQGEVFPEGVAGPAPMMDAFAAALGIDVLKGSYRIQKALADVDDGSLDGNTRVDYHDENGNGSATDELSKSLHSGDRRGDGAVDMKDFRAFRDALLQVLETADPEPAKASRENKTSFVSRVDLDGSDMHPKKDLNRDGQVALGEMTPTENVYPRFDFNGNGTLEPEGRFVTPGPEGVAPFKIDPDTVCKGLNSPAGCLRDIDVLLDPNVWNVTSDVTSSELRQDQDGDGILDYIYSADFHFIVEPEPTSAQGNLNIQIESLNDGQKQWTRSVEFQGGKSQIQRRVVTVPLFGERQVRVTVTRQGASANHLFYEGSAIPYGKDLVIRVKNVIATIDAADLKQKEGTSSANTKFKLDVTLSTPLPEPVAFTYNTSDGTAKASRDYVPLANGSLQFAAQQTTPLGPVVVDVFADSLPEENRSFNLAISGNAKVFKPSSSAPNGEVVFYVVLPPSPAVVTIEDDDALPAGSELWQTDITGTTVGPFSCLIGSDAYYRESASVMVTVPSPGLVKQVNDPLHGLKTFNGIFSNIETAVPASGQGCSYTVSSSATPNVSVAVKTGYGIPAIEIATSTAILMPGVFSSPYGVERLHAQTLTLYVDYQSPTTLSGTWKATKTANETAFAGGEFTFTKLVGLHADSSALQTSPTGQAISPVAAEALLPTVVDAWIGQIRLNDTAMVRPQVVITDLPGTYLAATKPGVVFLDRDAAGYGWFLDATPRRNEEFIPTSRSSFRAAKSGPAAGNMDLLTVLAHEVGHLLGLEDLGANADKDNVMAATLRPGVRRLPRASAVDAVLASGLW